MEGEKEALEHWIYFKNKLRNTWAAILKTSAVSRLKTCELKTYDEKANQSQFVSYWQKHKIITLKYGLTFIVDQIWKNKIYKLGKVDDRIQIQQLAKSRNKRQKQTDI